MTRRIKLTFSYLGTPFHGFQRQDNVPSIQGVIEDALYALTGETLTLQVAGRTDKGVHAHAQVCHFDTERDIKLLCFKDGINRFTAPEVCVLKAEHVADNFQARFDCISRRYEYVILNRRAPSPFWHGRAAHLRTSLDVEAMRAGAVPLLGRHDFSAFRSHECQAKSPITKLHSIEIFREEGDIIRICVHGAAFLHNMVRILCGTLVQVGEGKRMPEDVRILLESQNRCQPTLTLPACGLYFTEAAYHPHEVYEVV